MAQPDTDHLAYARESARMVELHTRRDLSATLERMASRMERATAVVRRLADRPDISPSDRIAWVQQELRLIGGDEDRLLEIGLVWEDARGELEGLEALLEAEQTA